MRKPQHTPELHPHDQAKLDRQRRDDPKKQPYTTETDDRELETAQKEKRPAEPQRR